MIAAICDDDVIFRKKMREFLLNYKRERRMHLDIVEFSNGNELLSYKYPLDIVFMDYEMPDLNGMETARILRTRTSLCCIIFISSYPQHVFESFEVKTYRYLVKPLDFLKLESVLDHYIREKKMMFPVTVNIDGEHLTINSEEIVYLEGDGKYCIIRTTHECFRASKTIAQIFDLLPQHCFYRAHKSYAVNFYCVHSIKANIVVLTNGEKIKISRTKIVDIKKEYKNFLKHFVTRAN